MKPRKEDRGEFNLPYLPLGGVAALSGLDRDTIWMLTEKGVLTSTHNEAGKMLFRREDIYRWLHERVVTLPQNGLRTCHTDAGTLFRDQDRDNIQR